MESVITELIKMDRKAKELIENARKQRDDAKAEIQKREKEIYDSMIRNSQEQLDKMKAEANAQVKKRCDEIEAKFHEAEEDLDLRFKQNFELWSDKIADNVLKNSQ